MQRLNIPQDIKPLSEVRTGIASCIKQVHDTRRPLIITQRGKGVAVLIDAQEFELIQEKLERLTDMQTSLNQLKQGQGLEHQEALNAVPRLDKGVVTVTALDDTEEKKNYWLSKSPMERLEAVETNRRMVYGEDRVASRLQKNVEVDELS